MTTTGPAVLALDDLLCDPDPRLAAELAELGERIPVAFRDQMGAAVADTNTNLHALAAAANAPVGLAVPGTGVPGWVRLGLLSTLTNWLMGAGRTCCHSPHWRRPEPVLAAAWKPDLVVCAACVHLLALASNSIATRTCDGCGRVTTGPDHGDGIRPCAVQLTALIYEFGACTDCQPEEKSA